MYFITSINNVIKSASNGNSSWKITVYVRDTISLPSALEPWKEQTLQLSPALKRDALSI